MQECNATSVHDWRCGFKFIKWGMGFFLFGLLFGFGVLIHYLVGSKWNTGADFLSNITLWFGSPLSLSVGYLQVGGLAMAIVGIAKLLMLKCCEDSAKCSTGAHVHHSHGHGALLLTIIGLAALFLTGYVGYFVIDSMWPGFYYQPITAGKNIWLVLQGISILVFFIGLVSSFCCLCCCCKKVCKTCGE